MHCLLNLEMAMKELWASINYELWSKSRLKCVLNLPKLTEFEECGIVNALLMGLNGS